MNAEELYQHIKDALSALGLGWNQKDEMMIELRQGMITFSHGNLSYVVRET